MSGIILFLSMLLICSPYAFTSNIISIQTGRTASGDTGKFAVIMKNETAVNGIQFTLQYDPDLITPIMISPVDIAGYLTGPAAYLDDENKIRFIVYDQGYNFISADSSRIFEVEYRVKDSLAAAVKTNLIFTEGMAADSGIMMMPFDFIDGEIDIDPAVGVDEPPEVLPLKFALFQNHPNPFNPVTIIQFDIPERTHVNLSVYNILGQEVVTLVDEIKEPGEYTVRWNAGYFPSGVYFYRMQTFNHAETKKLVLLR